MPGDIGEPYAGRLLALVQAITTPSRCPRLAGCSMTAGEVVDFDSDRICIRQAPFYPGRGFVLDADECCMCTVFVSKVKQRSISICVGAHILCAGNVISKEEPNCLTFDDRAVPIFRPELQEAMPWSVVHMFAGMFGGWQLATQWLSDQGVSVLFGQHISIDCDEDAMQVWEPVHQQKACRVTNRGPLPRRLEFWRK